MLQKAGYERKKSLGSIELTSSSTCASPSRRSGKHQHKQRSNSESRPNFNERSYESVQFQRGSR